MHGRLIAIDPKVRSPAQPAGCLCFGALLLAMQSGACAPAIARSRSLLESWRRPWRPEAFALCSRHLPRAAERLCCGRLGAGWQAAGPRSVLPPQRRSSFTARTALSLSPAHPPCRLVQDDSTGFVQFTLRIPSKQRFAAYDRRGALVAGGPDKEVEGALAPPRGLAGHWLAGGRGFLWCGGRELLSQGRCGRHLPHVRRACCGGAFGMGAGATVSLP